MTHSASLMSSDSRPAFQPDIKRAVLKIGTSTLCEASGSPDARYIADLAEQIAGIRHRGIEAVIVSSGAIRAGLDRLTLPHLPKSIPLKQAAAAVGQSRLMHLYATAFSVHGLEVAQVLLTRDDFQERRRYLHAANTLRALLRLGVVPIVNENDTVAVDEIKVGDNDTLAARVAAMIDADVLILLSDIDGLYTADPSANTSATLIHRVNDMESVASTVSSSKGAFGTGGMKTKMEAARIVTQCGIPMVIAHGRSSGVVCGAILGSRGTLFEPAGPRLSARKRWLAGSQSPAGVLTIHPEAVAQVTSYGKSLLAAGVLEVRGSFRQGDLVALHDRNNHTFARGIVSCDHKTLAAIKGLRSDQIVPVFGEKTTAEIVRRDDLLLLR